MMSTAAFRRISLEDLKIQINQTLKYILNETLHCVFSLFLDYIIFKYKNYLLVDNFTSEMYEY